MCSVIGEPYTNGLTFTGYKVAEKKDGNYHSLYDSKIIYKEGAVVVPETFAPFVKFNKDYVGYTGLWRDRGAATIYRDNILFVGRDVKYIRSKVFAILQMTITTDLMNAKFRWDDCWYDVVLGRTILNIEEVSTSPVGLINVSFAVHCYGV